MEHRSARQGDRRGVRLVAVRVDDHEVVARGRVEPVQAPRDGGPDDLRPLGDGRVRVVQGARQALRNEPSLGVPRVAREHDPVLEGDSDPPGRADREGSVHVGRIARRADPELERAGPQGDARDARRAGRRGPDDLVRARVVHGHRRARHGRDALVIHGEDVPALREVRRLEGHDARVLIEGPVPRGRPGDPVPLRDERPRPHRVVRESRGGRPRGVRDEDRLLVRRVVQVAFDHGVQDLDRPGGVPGRVRDLVIRPVVQEEACGRVLKLDHDPRARHRRAGDPEGLLARHPRRRDVLSADLSPGERDPLRPCDGRRAHDEQVDRLVRGGRGHEAEVPGLRRRVIEAKGGRRAVPEVAVLRYGEAVVPRLEGRRAERERPVAARRHGLRGEDPVRVRQGHRGAADEGGRAAALIDEPDNLVPLRRCVPREHGQPAHEEQDQHEECPESTMTTRVHPESLLSEASSIHRSPHTRRRPE